MLIIQGEWFDVYHKRKNEMSYKLVIAEKPSVAQSIAKVIGADKREDGYLYGNGYIVSWCVGHLVGSHTIAVEIG